MLNMLSKTPVLRHSGHLENKVGSHVNELVALRIQVQIWYTKRFAPVSTLSDAWEQNAAPILGCCATRPPWHITHRWPKILQYAYISKILSVRLLPIYTRPVHQFWCDLGFSGMSNQCNIRFSLCKLVPGYVYPVYGKLPRLTIIAYCYHFELLYVYEDWQSCFQVLGYGSLSSVTTLVATEQAALGGRGMGI